MTKATGEAAHAALERRALLAARALIDHVRSLYRELEQLTGAPITANRVLVCLGEEPGITASRLAGALGMQRPALSQVLKGLVEKGWIERVRDESDQRSVRVYLTSAGREVLAATTGRAVWLLQRAVRQLSEDELAGLAIGAEKVLSHLLAPGAKEIQRTRPRSKRPSPTRRDVVRAATSRPSTTKRRGRTKLRG